MQEKQNSTGLVWFANNLRIHDNESLTLACQNHEKVIAIYCFDGRQLQTTQFGFKKTEKFRAKFLIETVTELKKNLDSFNISLLVYQEYPEHVIPSLCDKYHIGAVYYQNEWTSEEQKVINLVKTILGNRVNFKGSYDQFLFHPEDVETIFQTIPQVFSNFRKKVEKYIEVKPEFSVYKMPESNLIINATRIPEIKDLGYEDFEIHPKSVFPFKGGENEAIKRLNYYFFESKKLGFYKKTRNGLLGKDYSSKFSPWLANGSISARTIYWRVREFETNEYKNQSTYWLIFELIWRDFFKYISMKFGNEIFKIGGILQKDYIWQTNSDQIQNWIDGNTTEPFVNANMLELKYTGWMSNRGRQNVASYFAKELELDWRIGAAYFESMLIDYDVHSNYGNWMYVAGVGNDPRDRKFNVKLQAERYDANNKFQNLWLQTSLF